MDIENQDRGAWPMHPALDIVGETLCVTVQARAGGAQQFVVLTSDGDIYRHDEWTAACTSQNRSPVVAAVPRRCGPRWHGAGIRETLISLREGGACPTTWTEAYTSIHAALEARLQMCDERFLVLLAVYAMMTYLHPLFDFLPILHLRGPAESGKSRAAHALAGLCFNGATFGCATDATLFRHAHEGRYTQIVAEADHLAALGPGHRFVRQLQSACSKAEATVDVAESATATGAGHHGSGAKVFVPTTYTTFSPRVFLSTQPFRSQPLRSRCIRLDLVRSTRADQAKLRVSVTDDDAWAPLRDKLYRLQLHRWRDVREAREREMVEWMEDDAPTGRAFDKWLPLVTVASLASKEALATIRALAAEDGLEHQRNAADRHEAHMALFALWLVREGSDKALSRKDLHDILLAPPSDGGTAAAHATPTWAGDTDAPVTIDGLRRAIPNQSALVRELARLQLIDGKAEHTRAKNVYRLQCERVLDAAGGIIGSDEVARVLGELERAA